MKTSGIMLGHKICVCKILLDDPDTFKFKFPYKHRNELNVVKVSWGDCLVRTGGRVGVLALSLPVSAKSSNKFNYSVRFKCLHHSTCIYRMIKYHLWVTATS